MTHNNNNIIIIIAGDTKKKKKNKKRSNFKKNYLTFTVWPNWLAHDPNALTHSHQSQFGRWYLKNGNSCEFVEIMNKTRMEK